MKKIIILLINISFLGACITNPITEKNYKPNNRPLNTGISWGTSLIPGLTQLLNGEYWESAAYFLSFITFSSIVEGYSSGSTQEELNNDIGYNTLMAIDSSIIIWNYIDGVYSTSVRNQQWNSFLNKDISKQINISEVGYYITGTAKIVDITLANGNGGTEQFTNIALPYFISYRTFASDYLYISAQNQGETGSVTVEIFYKGKLYKTSTSSGVYVIASASAGKPE